MGRIAKWKKPLLAFAVGQPAVQLLNVLTGFLLLRWLSKEAYAMFGVAFAFQSTVNQLTDLGFSGSIVALAGERGTEPAWLGRYLRAARHYRTRLLAFTLLGAAIAFPLLTWRQEWGAGTKLLLFGAVSVAVVFQSWMVYGSPLLVHRRLWDYYSPQIVGAAVRLGLCAGLYVAGLLSAWAVAWLGSLVIGWTGWSYRRASRDCAHEPAASDPETNREMRRYLAPFIPGAIFFALQGQITVGIISVFGSTAQLAEISAVGRIGQLFLLLNAFNAIVLEPYFARLPVSLLQRRYVQIVGAAVLLAVSLATVAFMFPKPLLWLLGPNYANMQQAVGWTVVSACITYVANLMWTMHAARRWVYWWVTNTYITCVIMVQVICAITMDLRNTIQVVWFGSITALVVFAVTLANGIYGLYYGHKRITKQS